MKNNYDHSATASDVPRSFKQYVQRQFSKLFVNLTGLNNGGELVTEIVQQINPVIKIPTRNGNLLCKGGHGRLLWRAKTFYVEEPETIKWLDDLNESDVLWDVGANVGLYSIYAAKISGCKKVYAFEPEAQNYSLLVENIAVNNAGSICMPVSIAISEKSGLGYLKIKYLTKGGAHNLFLQESDSYVPSSMEAVGNVQNFEIEQLTPGFSLDDLLLEHKLMSPTCIKIDVDGIEPLIIKGGENFFRAESLKKIIIEIDERSKESLEIPEVLIKKNFKLLSKHPVPLAVRNIKNGVGALPTNYIFEKVS